ncbi:MAG: hypothetical protein HPY61_09250 [Methanotrichaceae archaeon]|nr:hypothetical protein [Methanotrichaceae archaeon]
MNGRTLLEVANPVTQTAEAVKQLIAFYNHGQAPEEMPPFFRLSAEMVLVRNNKGDAYYVTTPRSCSCPSAIYRSGKHCKHQRKYFPAAQKVETARPQAEPRLRSGPFKPVQPEYAEQKKPAKASASSLVSDMAIDTYAPVTLPGEVEYWQQKAEAI